MGTSEGSSWEGRVGAIWGFEADFGSGPLTNGVDLELQVQYQWGKETTEETTFTDALTALAAEEEASILGMRVPTRSLELKVSRSSVGITGDYTHVEPVGPIGFSVVSVDAAEERYNMEFQIPKSLKVVPGDLRTYPSFKAAAPVAPEACDDGIATWADDKHIVGVGGGRTGTEIAMETMQSETRFQNLDVEAHVVGKVKGVKSGASGGFTLGKSWGITKTSGIVLGAEMGQLQDPIFDDQGYTWSMFLCDGELTATTSNDANVTFTPWFLGYGVEGYSATPAKDLFEPVPFAPTSHEATTTTPPIQATLSVDKYQTVHWELEAAGIEDRRTYSKVYPTGSYVGTWDPVTAVASGETGPLKPGHEYRWRVWVEQPTLGETPKTEWNYFVPMDTPPVPVIVPEPTVVADYPTFVWDSPDPTYWNTTATLSRQTSEGYEKVVTSAVDNSLWQPNVSLDQQWYRLDVERKTPLGHISSATIDFLHAPEAPLQLMSSESTTPLGRPVTFTAIKSDGVSEPSWSTEQGTLTDMQRTMTFETPGLHEVSVTAIHDGDRVVARAAVLITNPAPTLDFSWEPVQPVAGGLVEFTTTAEDPDGGTVTVSWSSRSQPPESFDHPGLHRVCATGTDDDGTPETDPPINPAKTVQCHDILVLNRAPTAAFGLEDETGAPLPSPLGTNEPMTLRSMASDPDGQQLDLQWQVGTNVFDGPTATWTPDHPGKELICQTATDPDGAQDHHCVTFEVPNDAPVARMTHHSDGRSAPAILHVAEGVPLRLYDRSHDDGPELTSTWTEPFATDAATFHHAFIGTGLTRVCLEATDGGGEVNGTCQDLHVVNPLPKPEFHWWAGAKHAGSLIQFRDSSSDPNSDITAWYWTFGDGDVATIQHPVKRFDMPGTYEVCLQVRDEHGGLNAPSETACRNIRIDNPAPVAAFSLASSPQWAGSVLSFDDESTDANSEITQWRWNFGDGHRSTIQHPDHQYDRPGTYEACLRVQDEHGAWSGNVATSSANDETESSGPTSPPDDPSDGGDDGVSDAVPSFCVQVEITNPAPEPDFTAHGDGLLVGSDVWFEDRSTDVNSDIHQWRWDFADGAKATTQHPFHRFTWPGAYDVCLKVQDEHGAWDETPQGACHEVKVTNLPPVADLSWPNGIYARTDPIPFEDLSTDGNDHVAAWTWDFGDGTTSDHQHPVKVYDSDGNYMVCLTVWDAYDEPSDQTCRTIHVYNPPPTAAFTGWEAEVLTYTDIRFTDASKDANGEIVAWSWDFGDGNASVDPSPVHAYADDGVYPVCLTVWDRHGDPSVEPSCHNVTILNRPPSVDFRYAQGLSRLEGMRFLDASGDLDGTVESWRWDIAAADHGILAMSGGATALEGPRPWHRFDHCGVRDVTLTVWDDDGASSSLRLPVDVFETLVETPRHTIDGAEVDTPLVGIDTERPRRTIPGSTIGTCLFMEPIVQVDSPPHPSAVAWRSFMGVVDGVL